MAFLPEQIGAPSAGNSSTANILDTLSFTGEWEEIEVGTGLIVTIKADRNLTVVVQYSPDGTNIDSALTSYYKTDQIEPPIVYANARSYFRVVVTNDSGADTTLLRLNSTITSAVPILEAPVNGTLSQDFPSISSRGTDFDDEVALGRRQGVSNWTKFGYNADVDTGAAEILASFGGTFSRMTVADTLSVVSSSVNDTNAGTGVNSIVIYGIDTNRDELIEVVTMNGTTPVVTSGSFLGVNRVAAFLSGTGETNAGTITVTATTATSVQAEMPVGEGVTQQLIFHVPQNHTYLVEGAWFSTNKLTGGGGSPRVNIKGWVYSAINNTNQEIFRATIDTSVDNFIHPEFDTPVPIGEKSILFITASTDVNNTTVTGRFGGKLYRDVDS